MKETRYRYSTQIPGDAGNYEWPVLFDRSTPGGYVGITQTADSTERVLLSPAQVRALLAFLRVRR